MNSWRKRDKEMNIGTKSERGREYATGEMDLLEVWGSFPIMTPIQAN